MLYSLFNNKIMMLIIEILSTVVTVVRRSFIVYDLGNEKFVLIMVVLVLSVFITLSESPKEDR